MNQHQETSQLETRGKKWEMMDDDMAEVLRKKTEAERLAIANGMWRSVYQIVMTVVSHAHPNWTEEEIRHEVARRMSHESD